LRAILIEIIDYIVYDVWIAVELAVVYFLFVETGNMSLEQTAAILDGTPVQEKFIEEVARSIDFQNETKKTTRAQEVSIESRNEK